MELVKTEQNDVETYEKLLLKRDACQKQALAAQVLYFREFGGLITKSFEKKVDCIAKKKCIAYYQAAANRGETVKLEELDAYLKSTMEEYNRQLHDMLRDYETCRNSKVVPEHTVVQVKMLYRKIAKLIHPDMHPELAGQENLNELWSRVVNAYQRNDLELLQELEILVQKALQENGEDVPEIVIPNLAERVAKLKEEIEKIKSTDPYLYRELLEDKDAVEEKKRELNEEIKEYQAYAEQLDQLLQEFLKGGVILWPVN